MLVNFSFSAYPFLPLPLLVLPLGWQDSVQFASPNWLLSMHNAFFFILMNHQLALMAFLIICLTPLWNFLGGREGGKTAFLPHVLLRCWSQLSFFHSPCLLCRIFSPLSALLGGVESALLQLFLFFFLGSLWTVGSSEWLISLVTGC